MPMRAIIYSGRAVWLTSLVLFVSLLAGCDNEEPPLPKGAKSASEKKADDKTKVAKRTEIAKNIYFELKGERRRILVPATVCLTKGPLELLLTRKNTKEHEAVFAAEIDARALKSALMAAKAKEGKPVSFDPKYVPATGQVINISVEYTLRGKTISVPAQEFILNVNTKQILTHNWVFAGSKLVPNPLDPKRPSFLANDGDVVCVSNFESALLDLPIRSSKEAADLSFEANTAKIPPVGTKVTIIFEPNTAPRK
jgi:hypothetical protein